MIEINTLAGLLSALIAAIIGIISYFKGHTTGYDKGRANGYSQGRIDTVRAQMSMNHPDQAKQMVNKTKKKK